MNSLRTMIDAAKKASDSYYNTGTEIMSNMEYDELVRRIEQTEKETGIIYPDSPTQTVGYTVSDGFKKVKHEYPSLSLDKTKDRTLFLKKFEDFLHDDRRQKRTGIPVSNEAVLMWKMDGSTIVATYDGGRLSQLATRGNGEIGSDITANAPFIHGLPKQIPYTGHLVVRGEAVMSYEEFNRINAALPDDMAYKNPRNLANASILLLDNSELARRKIEFFAFNLVTMEHGFTEPYTINETQYRLIRFSDRLNLLADMGFQVVERAYMHIDNLGSAMDVWDKRAETYAYPVDGLVVAADDAAYADTLPGTGHNPNIMRGYAFKWADEEEESVLRDIEWSPSRTGLLNPVAVFDPVDLEGTTVTKASLHNISYISEMNLQVGDHISVYKANKIIPQIAKNLDKDSHGNVSFDGLTCPVCGSRAVLVKSDASDTIVAKCPNEGCAAKHIGQFVHYCERDCADIRGLSEETLTKFVNAGFIHELADLYRLDRYKTDISAMPGFGEKSYANIQDAIDRSKKITFTAFVHALGIPNIGKGQAKLLHKYIVSQRADRSNATCNMFVVLCALVHYRFDFTTIDGIGPVMNSSLYAFFTDNIVADVLNGTQNTEIGRLLQYVTIEDEIPKQQTQARNKLEGLTFVITGAVHHFKNRDELKAKIEEFGGKASGSVTGKTNYLINNDVESTSGKNKKAKELGIKIISEDEFIRMIQ